MWLNAKVLVFFVVLMSIFNGSLRLDIHSFFLSSLISFNHHKSKWNEAQILRDIEEYRDPFPHPPLSLINTAQYH